MTLLDFRRPFQIWVYSVSHGQLLLRSNKSGIYETRIDVLFKNVSYMNIATNLDVLMIRQVEYHFIKEIGAPVDGDAVKNRNFYELRSNGNKGYIFSGSVNWHEDNGSHYEASFFQSSFLFPV